MTNNDRALLRAARSESRIPLQILSAELGIHTSTLHAWENGVVDVPPDVVARWRKVLMDAIQRKMKAQQTMLVRLAARS